VGELPPIHPRVIGVRHERHGIWNVHIDRLWSLECSRLYTKTASCGQVFCRTRFNLPRP
jgi:hypothetical protein